MCSMNTSLFCPDHCTTCYVRQARTSLVGCGGVSQAKRRAGYHGGAHGTQAWGGDHWGK